MKLTFLMPCLNEEKTVAFCIAEARSFLEKYRIDGEILIVDNNSTDRSSEIAKNAGARVVLETVRGYGSALRRGIAEAQGDYIIMGDCDCSYDFAAVAPMLERLEKGADVVIGNRYLGGFQDGASPFLHRYFGVPLLSLAARLRFRVKIGDFHCGIRGCNTERLRALPLCSNGMEFATEMIARAAMAGYRLEEVPAVLRPDQRERRPHLRPIRDALRHLRMIFFLK